MQLFLHRSIRDFCLYYNKKIQVRQANFTSIFCRFLIQYTYSL